jgi:putative ABC transport system substrate-binding protein
MKFSNWRCTIGRDDKAKLAALALWAALFALCASTEAQTKKVFRLGWLRFLAAPPTDPTHVAFNEGLRTLGYYEGKNVVVEYRSAEGKPEGRAKAAAKLTGLDVDVIVASPAPPLIRAAQEATQTIPIIMGGVFVDPMEAGFVKSLARPGGNITGITNLESDLHPKRLELLKEAFPRISRVAILWPEYQQKPTKDQIHATGKALGIQIHTLVGERRINFGGDRAPARPNQQGRHRRTFNCRVCAHLKASRADHGVCGPEAAADNRYTRFLCGDGWTHVLRCRFASIVPSSRDILDKGAKPADLPVERPRNSNSSSI